MMRRVLGLIGALTLDTARKSVGGLFALVVRMMSRTLLCTVVLLAASAWTTAAPLQQGHAPQCRATGPVAQIPELSEASGIAASRRTPGRFWAHNDSGEPVLVALNDRGAVTGRVRLTGVMLEDWEATAVGPCPSGSCVYVADIGDNSGNRKSITVYRIPEPDATSDHSTPAEAFHATYPDGPHDAEALLVTGKGDLFVVTKGNSGPVTVYQFPRDVRPGSTVALTRVGQPYAAGKKDRDEDDKEGEARVTDGTVSPNGQWIVLRSNNMLYVFPAAEVTSGTWRNETRVDLTNVREPQGEGVTFADDTTLVLVGEGGGKSRAGTFVRLTCTF
jgi:hypothetical protein